MKKKYKKRVEKTTKKLSEACTDLSKRLMDASLDGSVETEFDFIEKDKKLYFRVEFTLPAMSLK